VPHPAIGKMPGSSPGMTGYLVDRPPPVESRGSKEGIMMKTKLAIPLLILCVGLLAACNQTTQQSRPQVSSGGGNIFTVLAVREGVAAMNKKFYGEPQGMYFITALTSNDLIEQRRIPFAKAVTSYSCDSAKRIAEDRILVEGTIVAASQTFAYESEVLEFESRFPSASNNSGKSYAVEKYRLDGVLLVDNSKQ
jgi:hypothetical protein